MRLDFLLELRLLMFDKNIEKLTTVFLRDVFRSMPEGIMQSRIIPFELALL